MSRRRIVNAVTNLVRRVAVAWVAVLLFYSYVLLAALAVFKIGALFGVFAMTASAITLLAILVASLQAISEIR